MKKFMTIAAASILTVAGTYPATADQATELGVIAGEPTGLSFRTWLGGQTAFTAAAAWSFVDESALHVHGDLTRRVPGFIDTDSNDIGFYYGLGGLAEFDDNSEDRLAVRAPLGLDFLMESAPIVFFGEIAPVLDVAPDTEVRANGAIGARYVF